MTDNTQLKQDATELLNKIIIFKRNYGFLSSRKQPSGADEFERELRIILSVARTDDENKNQNKIDSYC